jgi:hypothetical protein
MIQAVRGYIAYSGSSTVDDAARRVHHHQSSPEEIAEPDRA